MGIFNGAYGDGSKPVLLEWFIYGESYLKIPEISNPFQDIYSLDFIYD